MADFNNFFVCGPKFTKFLSSNVEGVAVDQVFFRYSICRSVPEIFAMKVESCQKSRKMLDDFFALTNFWGGHCKNCTHVITPASRDVDWKKYREDTPTSPEVISSNTLNFRPNF